MSCSCYPSAITSSTTAAFHPGNVEFVGTVPPRADPEVTPSAARKMLDGRVESTLEQLAGAISNFFMSWRAFEKFVTKHQETDMPRLMLLLGEMLEAFDAVSCRVMDLDLLTDMRGDRSAVDDVDDVDDDEDEDEYDFGPETEDDL